ncbi:MAG: GNAT family N-acetyltransferase [Pirellulales bacterium]
MRIPDPIELSDEIVLLRPFRLDDVDYLYHAVRGSLPELQAWLPWCHAEYCREEAEQWVESRAAAWHRGTEYSFVIEQHGVEGLVGGCGLNQIDDLRLRANLGYWVQTSRTGHGLATAAARLLARWGLQNVGLQRVEIVAAVDNTASQRVAQKAGAVHEGVFRRRLRVHGHPHDARIYSLINEDFD